MLALAATGEHLSGATLVGVTDGAGQAKVYQLDLADVLVTNVEHHADLTTEAGPTLTLDYSKIELETFTPDGTGGAVPEGQFGFDLTTNTAGITVPSADPGGSVAASPEPMDYFMLIDGLNGGSLDKQHIGLVRDQRRRPRYGEARRRRLRVPERDRAGRGRACRRDEDGRDRHATSPATVSSEAYTSKGSRPA